MDIEDFHQRFIANGDDDPWAVALRRVCDYQHDGELTGSRPASAASWSPWNPANRAALTNWDPWGANQRSTAGTTELHAWDMWNATETQSELAAWTVWHEQTPTTATS